MSEAVLDIKRDFLETLSGCRRIGPDDLHVVPKPELAQDGIGSSVADQEAQAVTARQ